MLDPLRILRRHERFLHDVDQEVAIFVRRFGDEALSQAQAKLARGDLTSRYRKVLIVVAKRLGKGAPRASIFKALRH